MAQPTETSGAASEATPAEGELKRGLSARHMQMIAIGVVREPGAHLPASRSCSRPHPRAINDGVNLLRELGALTERPRQPRKGPRQ